MLKINQLKFLCLLLACLTMLLLYRFVTDKTLNTNDILIHREYATNTINPNTAQWPSLSRLPGIGQSKAKAIVCYRNNAMQSNPSGQPVFKSAADLTAVKGIGKKTVNNIEPYLIFNNEK